MSTDQPPNNASNVSETQAKRRVVYGLNTVIAIAAGVAVIAGVNWLTATQLDRLPPGVLRVVRFDLTRTRQYSLAEQTVNTLTALPSAGRDYRVVTLLPANDTERKQALKDLLDEYRSYAPALQVEHLNQGVDIPQEDALYATIRERFADELKPILETVDRGLAVLADTTERLQSIVRSVEQTEAVAGDAATGRTKTDLIAVRTELTNLVDQLLRVDRAFEEALKQPLPRYEALVTGEGGLEPVIKQVRQALAGSAVYLQRIKPRLQRPAPQAAIHATTAESSIQALRESLNDAVNALSLTTTHSGYTDAANTLGRGPCAVVVGPEAGGVRVLPAERLFVTSAAAADNRFLGEELITGALLSLQLDPPPMAVFIVPGRTGALAPRGVFQTVARRLETLRFDLREWRIQSRDAEELGNPYVPDPADTRLPNQNVVYVFMPYEPIDAQGAASGGASGGPSGGPSGGGMAEQQAYDRYLSILQSKLDSDDGVLLMARPEPKPAAGESKLAPLLRPYRIAPLVYKPIIEERVVGQLTEPSWELGFTNWPETHVITRSLQGQPGVVFAGTAVTILSESQSTQGVTAAPLVSLSGERMWALADFTDIQDSDKMKFDPDRWQRAFTPIVASEKEARRLVFACADAWADDRIVTYGRDGNRNTAAYTGYLFPGNTELFVNSVLWLTDLDRLIAKSPRLQDIRRVEPLSNTENTVLRAGLLGGVPLLIGFAGMVVWSARRKG